MSRRSACRKRNASPATKARGSRRGGRQVASSVGRPVVGEHPVTSSRRGTCGRARPRSGAAARSPGGSRSICAVMTASTCPGSASSSAALRRARAAPRGTAGCRPRARRASPPRGLQGAPRSPRADELACGVGLQGLQLDRHAGIGGRSRPRRSRPSRRCGVAHSEPRFRRGLGAELAQQVGGRVVHPVDVLEDHEQRRLREQRGRGTAPTTSCTRARRNSGASSAVSGVGDVEVEREREQREPRQQLRASSSSTARAVARRCVGRGGLGRPSMSCSSHQNGVYGVAASYGSHATVKVGRSPAPAAAPR